MCALNIDKVNKLIKNGKKVTEIAKEYKVTRQAVYAHLAKAKKNLKKKKSKQISKKGKNYKSLINWRIYNEALVKRGEILLDFDIFKEWEEELIEMNEGKRGRRYEYPESFIIFLLRLKAVFGIDYRSLEGIGRRIIVFIGKAKRAIDYTTVQKRFKEMEIKLEVYQGGLENQQIAGDCSGLKSSKRGEYRISKYREGLRKRYVKLHIAVNIKTRQVVASIVTGEEESESKKMEEMIKIAERYGKVNKAIFDSGYDSKENYWYLKERGIEGVIKPRETLAGEKLRKEILEIERKLSKRKDKRINRSKLKKRLERLKVMEEYQRDEERWKEKYKYGIRWRVEGRYSVFKRIFGEEVFSKEMEIIEKEVQLKVNLMNWFTSMMMEAYKQENMKV